MSEMILLFDKNYSNLSKTNFNKKVKTDTVSNLSKRLKQILKAPAY